MYKSGWHWWSEAVSWQHWLEDTGAPWSAPDQCRPTSHCIMWLLSIVTTPSPSSRLSSEHSFISLKSSLTLSPDSVTFVKILTRIYHSLRVNYVTTLLNNIIQLVSFADNCYDKSTEGQQRNNKLLVELGEFKLCSNWILCQKVAPDNNEINDNQLT